MKVHRKSFIYNQLYDYYWKVENPLLKYKGKFKQNLNSIDIPL